ncbi:MAG: superoxide dismutase family protein [Clostridia bacterium]|nr:superoxide dismutase family protein [Clostridia bacterium]
MTELNGILNCVIKNIPQAVVEIKGSEYYPDIRGKVKFYTTRFGTVVSAEVYGLPFSYEPCASRFFGFHIHTGEKCSPVESDAFSESGSHYNPYNCEHPKHSGDLPPLLGNNGTAFQIFLTDGFSVKEVIGRTVIVHLFADDFMTQPSGNSGEKIACGVIKLTQKNCRVC